MSNDQILKSQVWNIPEGSTFIFGDILYCVLKKLGKSQKGSLCAKNELNHVVCDRHTHRYKPILVANISTSTSMHGKNYKC